MCTSSLGAHFWSCDPLQKTGQSHFLVNWAAGLAGVSIKSVMRIQHTLHIWHTVIHI
uniref:Uncharacterized protein n=1 Tax=Anguilla anguilla TaxID=7936 RepID=A0A0E9SLY6_ANGAN